MREIPIETDVIVSRTMVTDVDEHNEIIARFFEYGSGDVHEILKTVTAAAHGLPSGDPMSDASCLVYQLIANGMGYMVPTANPTHDLFNRREIHVELVVGVTQYSKGQLFSELLITYVYDGEHVVISAADLIIAMTNGRPISTYSDPTSRWRRSRRGYMVAAAFELRFSE
jgi:hypothetical protein